MDGEDVEMAYRCGDLVPYDRGEVFCHAQGLRGRTIIGVVIVIGGHRQFNALTGNAEHGLFQCGIPMPAEGSCVDVGIGCNPSTGVHLHAQWRILSSENLLVEPPATDDAPHTRNHGWHKDGRSPVPTRDGPFHDRCKQHPGEGPVTDPLQHARDKESLCHR